MKTDDKRKPPLQNFVASLEQEANRVYDRGVNNTFGRMIKFRCIIIEVCESDGCGWSISHFIALLCKCNGPQTNKSIEVAGTMEFESQIIDTGTVKSKHN